MRRGDIHIVDFEPARGSEVDKRRPAIIVSNDASNAIVTRLGRGLLTVVPLTTNIARLYKFQVLLPAARTGLDSDSKAQAEQVRSVGVERVGDRIGLVPYSLLDRVDDALRIHLDLG
jgi:mRNA interferase MazF